jgi:hypothetical protein
MGIPILALPSSVADTGLYNVKGERMFIARLVHLFVFIGVLVLMAVPSFSAAACPACSGIGQSRGYYAAPTNYGGYGPGYGYPAQIQPVRSKAVKSKKRSPKQKPAAQ